MVKSKLPYVLASASPRRREICEMLDLPVEIIPAKDEPAPQPAATIQETVLQIARGKAEEVAKRYPGRTVIGADTVVAIDGALLGKPQDDAEAVQMLLRLQGREHQVVTAVWVCRADTAGSPNGDGFADTAVVTFYPMTLAECEAYVSTGEPMDKAGAYAVQGKGMKYISHLDGDFYTVMGLPGSKLWRFLKQKIPQ